PPRPPAPPPCPLPYTTLFRSRAMPPELTFPPDEVRPPTTDARTVLLRVVNGGSAQDDAFAIIHVPASKGSLSVLVLNPRTIIERSEEHTSELQSRFDLVCRLL